MAGIFLPQRALRQKPPVGARFNPNCSLARGLQCFYAFNEGGGTSFAEASMQHPAATIGNGSGSPACWQIGPSGPAVQLSSSNGYVSAGNICDNMASFTVSCWFRFASTFPNATIVSKWGSGGYASGQGWAVTTFGGEVSVLTQLSGGSTYNQIATTSNYNDGKWHHGVFIVSAYVATSIYIDGVKVATSVGGSGTVTTTTNSGNLTFGGDTSGSDWWNGSLDSVAIWNRTLNANEIERLYVEPYYLMTPGGQSLLSKRRAGKFVGPIQTLAPKGIPSQAVHGAQGVAENILPFGIITQETIGASGTATNNARNLFPSGITTAEAEGTITFNNDLGPLGITSAEAEGKPAIGLNLRPLGLTTSELLGALKAAVATHNPINIPLRRRAAYNKPQIGATVNTSHPLAQGLAAGWIFSDGGGASATELLTGITSSFSGSPLPTWQSGLFGPAAHFPGGSSGGRVAISSLPAFTDLGLSGPMSVSFWYNYDAAQLATSGGSAMMGKGDNITHGWIINSDNWHLDINGNPVNSGPQYIKLEFECGTNNKQGGIPAPTTSGTWHHIVMMTAGGASTPSTNDYTIYLDGVLQQNLFFVPGTGTATASDSGFSMAIGSYPNGTAPFTGFLDNVLLYKRLLTSTEAQQLYTDPFCFINKRRQRMRATHSTSSLSITPLGIASGERVGAFSNVPIQNVSPLGISSEARLGALQAAIANLQTLHPGAIVTLETVGNSITIAVSMTTPSSRIFNPAAQYRIFNLKLEERTL
jgi:hypothetical protein